MRVILVSQVTADKAFFEEVAKAANLSFQQFTNPMQAVDDLVRDNAAIVIVDASTQALYTAFERCIADKLGLYSAIVNPNHYFYIANNALHDLPYLHNSQIFGSFIQRKFKPEDQALLSQVIARFAEDKAFSVEKYLPIMAKCQVLKMAHSEEKFGILEGMKEFLVRWGLNLRMVPLIVSAVDELIMYALYDAPVDELEKPIHASMPRNTSLVLNEKKQLEIRMAHDDNVVGISVTDQNGSIDRAKLLSLVNKSYKKEEFRVKSNFAGADMGFGEVYQNSGGMLVVSEPGVRSEFMLFYKKTSSFKTFREQLRFLSGYIYSA